MRAIASTLIYAVVLCESAQRYRALRAILPSHRTQNMILRCYLLYFGDIPNLVSCAFSTIPIFPPYTSQNFVFTCLCSFFDMLCSIRREHQARAFLHTQHPCCIHKPVLGTRYSSTIPRRKTCTNHDITV